jgi:hypothetical protein
MPGQLIRKDMYINEHWRLSNITLRHTLKEQSFNCCSSFLSYNRVLSNELNYSYPKISVELPLAYSGSVLLPLNVLSGHLCHLDVIWCVKCYISDAKFNNQQENKMDAKLYI